MKFAIADDEEHAIKKMKSLLEKVKPDSEIHTFSSAKELLAHLEQNEIDVAFLDVEMPGISGLELTIKIKELRPKTGIILVTGYSQYALEAHGLYVSGFLLKPTTAEKVEDALNHLRPIAPAKPVHIRVQCFGNFDVFVDGNVLTFPRSKSKELLAYLVHNEGTSATTTDIAAILWEDRPYDRPLQQQTQKIISVMMQTLKNAGAVEMVIRTAKNLMVDITKFECDSYDFMKWDTLKYTGDYLRCYSWAEMKMQIFSQWMSNKLQDGV